MGKPFNYGGQAVIEGVMMRGSCVMAVAVRDPDGHIVVASEPLNEKLYTGPISRIPFLRGVITLWDTLGLGMKALQMSADIAVGEEASLSGPATWGMLVVALLLGVGLFIALPSFLGGLIAPLLPYEWLSSLAEGVIRLLIMVGYMWAIGFMPDIRRVFAYHGAEHKTIHAHEADVDLTVENVRHFTTAHARCGTAFLLTLVVLTILIFAPFGEQSLIWRVTSRLLLLPVIAGISYEIIRLMARWSDHPLMQALAVPNLALQRLTTRKPDDEMLEVAITALKTVLRSENQDVSQSPSVRLADRCDRS